MFKVLDSFVTSNGLWWSRCVGICTDGPKAMTGRHSGMVTRVQAFAPDATWVHCSIHREALAAKGMPDSLKDILGTTVKMVNFVKTRSLNSLAFSASCNDQIQVYLSRAPNTTCVDLTVKCLLTGSNQ